MMTKTYKLLSATLLVQLLIAGGIYWSQHNNAGSYQTQSLLSAQLEKIDEIIINASAESGDNSVTLNRVNGQSWQLSELNNLPVNQQKLKTLLEQLNQLAITWPVAKTQSSQKRFEVSDDNYQRKVQFFSGDELLDELYLGTSPGFRKSHIRRGGEDETYSVEINSFDFPTDNKNWLDTSFLAIKDIETLKTGDVALEKNQGQWFFATDNFVSTPVEVDQEKVNQLVNQLGSLNITDIAEEGLDLSTASTITIDTGNNSGQQSYNFIHQGDQYYVKRGDIDTVFAVGQQLYTHLSTVTVAALSVIPAKTEDVAADDVATEENASDETVTNNAIPGTPAVDSVNSDS